MGNRLYDHDMQDPDDNNPHNGVSAGCFLLMVVFGLIIAAVIIYFLLSLPSNI